MVSAKIGILNENTTVLTLFDLNILLNSGRHQMLSKLALLSISSLRKLDDTANKFNDRKHDLYEAALLTRCYIHHALRPYIDSEINLIRNSGRRGGGGLGGGVTSYIWHSTDVRAE